MKPCLIWIAFSEMVACLLFIFLRMWDGCVKSAFLYLQAYFGQCTSGEELFGNKDQNFLYRSPANSGFSCDACVITLTNPFPLC